MQLILYIAHASSANDEITGALQGAIIASFEPAAIMNHEVIITEGDMFSIDARFATCGIGYALK